MKLDWLIIGGGINGVHIAARLIGEADVAPEALRIVDPGARLLERWRTCRSNGRCHLRSPSVHTSIRPWSLTCFADGQKNPDGGLFAPPYNRPHSNSLTPIAMRSSRPSIWRASCEGASRVMSARLRRGEAELDDTQIEANNVVLAMGSAEQPDWPDWAPHGDKCVSP